MDSDKVCIVGAGLAGTMLATYLARRGFEVDLYEKRPDVRLDFQSGNRTIAMSISYRGIKALEGIGLSTFVKDHTIPKHSRMVHCIDGSTNVQRYGQEGHTINTIDRRQLNEVLLNRAEQTQMVTFHFQHECENINPDTGQITFSNSVTDELITRQYRWIISADGIFSNVRRILEADRIVKTDFLEVHYGYRELLIPPDENGQHRMKSDHVHVWPRGNYIMVGLPSQGGVFTCNLFLPSEGDLSLATIQRDDDVLQLFNQRFSSVIPIMPTLTKDYFHNAASKIHAIKCFPWNYKDKVLMIGDAAHAIVPFFAMGMNTCFEDCTVFDQMLERYDNDLSKVIEKYGETRKPDTDAIGDLSYNNFNEISKSPGQNYHLKWKLDRTIWEMFPEKWMPLYPMVAFSDIPLSAAVSRASKQQDIILQAIESGKFDSFTDDDCIRHAVKEHFEPILKQIEPVK